MAIFNEEYIQEFLFNKKNKNVNTKQYHHLNKNEIYRIVAIAKKEIGKFTKLKKATQWLNLNKSRYDEDDEPSLLSEYYKNSGGSDLIIADGDAWDGYSALRSNPDEFWNDQSNFCDSVNNILKEESILAKFYPTGNSDWDGIEFAIKSLKEK